MTSYSTISLLEKAIASRAHLVDDHHDSAFRLLNGFSEGNPELVIDIYARTVVIHDYADNPDQKRTMDITDFMKESLQWLKSGIVKTRAGKTHEERCGQFVFGNEADMKINENGVWYAIDLMMNRDASFYLDTRNLRKWLIDNMHGKSVLNTFAYTGSLGIAALAGGASRVIQQDHSKKFLNLARISATLNKISDNKQEFVVTDFFPAVAKYKATKQFFDYVILDPPFFSTTPKGRVDQERESARLINKARPLINDEGYLIAINNAVYTSGKEYLNTLEALCRDGYLEITELIPVPDDCRGCNIVRAPITDPAPFNHSTKIAVLKVKRKHRRVA